MEDLNSVRPFNHSLQARGMELRELLGRLQEFGLLLDTDPKFPNVTALLAGEAVRGSWWTHPKAHDL